MSVAEAPAAMTRFSGFRERNNLIASTISGWSSKIAMVTGLILYPHVATEKHFLSKIFTKEKLDRLFSKKLVKFSTACKAPFLIIGFRRSPRPLRERYWLIAFPV